MRKIEIDVGYSSCGLKEFTHDEVGKCYNNVLKNDMLLDISDQPPVIDEGIIYKVKVILERIKNP